jgi:hypothetical protein
MKKNQCVFLVGITLICTSFLFAQQPKDIKHVIAAIEKDKFHGWPANNGSWHWGDEILVGFTQGDFQVKGGHNIAGIQHSMFARSLDGGETWEVFDPENFLDDENIKWLPKGKKYLEKPIDFRHKGFAMRIFATGYHGNDDPEGGFYYSYDRGSTWNGPYFLGKINDHKELKGKILNPRTDYIVMSERECFIYIAARDTTNRNPSRIGCITTNDGGMSFDFVSWVTPATQKSHAIMSSTVQLSENKFILTHRDIKIPRKPIESTIDAYVSNDRCQSWRFLSTVKVIYHNSNPPALVKLKDGRLCCIYGDRDNLKVSGKYSDDEGKTWGEEFIIREDFKTLSDWGDFGYPRLMQRTDGKLVAMYYWTSPEHVQQHIAVSIWKP